MQISMCFSLRTQADHVDACREKPRVFTLEHSELSLQAHVCKSDHPDDLCVSFYVVSRASRVHLK